MKCMNNIKEYLNKIRKPSSNQNKIVNNDIFSIKIYSIIKVY